MSRARRDDQKGPDGRLLALQMIVAGSVMGGVRPAASYRALELGSDAFGIGVLAASFAAGTIVFAIPLGRLIARLGPQPVLVAGASGVPVAVAIIVCVTQEWLLWVGCAMLGVTHLAILVSCQTLATIGRSGITLDRSFGNLTAATSVGQMLGPLLTLALPALLEPHTTLSPNSAGLLLSLLASLTGPAAAVIHLQRRTIHMRRETTTSPQRPEDAPHDIRDTLRIGGMRRALVVSGIVLASVDILTAYLPLWASSRDISPFLVGVLLWMRAGVTLLSRIGLTRAITLLGRRTVLIVSLLCGAVGFGALPLLGSLGALAVMFILGIGLGMAQPLTLSWVASRVNKNPGPALSLRMLSNRLFQTTAPPLIAVTVPALGLAFAAADQAFIAASLLTAAAALLAACISKNDMN